MNEHWESIAGKVKNQLDSLYNVQDEELKQIIEGAIREYIQESFLSIEERANLNIEIFNSIRKYDVLQELLDDETITEIMVVGHEKIYVEKKGCIELTGKKFGNVTKLEDIIQRMVSSVNRMVNEGSPVVDARLGDGSRVNVVLPPIAIDGPILTIRKFSKYKMSMNDLINRESITADAADFLQKLVKAKYNLFISGGTGSGKTTFLNVLSNSIPSKERIVTIEDSAELKLEGIDHIVRMETRNTNTEGAGAIGMKELIKSSLRMRPDRIIVGEVRGEEAFDMLQAMNTGHEGSMSTGHSNSGQDMLFRLENMILMGKTIPIEAIRQQIGAAIDVIIHLERNGNGKRQVVEITELIGYQNNQFQLNPLYALRETDCGEKTLQKLESHLVKRRNGVI